MSDFVVVRKDPGRWRWWLLGILVSLGLGLGLFEAGRYSNQHGWLPIWASRDLNHLSTGDLEADNFRLKEQLGALQRTTKIDRKSLEVLQTDYHALQDEILGLREELSFYRGLVSPDGKKEGLYVQRVKLTQSVPNHFNMLLVLAHVTTKDREVQGSATVSIEGKLDDVVTVYPLSKLTNPPKKNWKFDFRYFQNLSDELILPKDFIPTSISVKLVAKRKGAKPVEKTFPWSVSAT